MILAYISTDVASQVCERVAYGMVLIAVTVGIGFTMALIVRPRK